MPLGSELLKSIREALDFSSPKGNGDVRLAQALMQYSARSHITYPEFQEAAVKIRKASIYAKSIDNIIEQFADDEAVRICGKAAIISEILKAERSSSVYTYMFSGEFDTAMAVAGTWYGELLSILIEGIASPDLASVFENLTIVSFNYDRTLEQYLPIALKDARSISSEEANSIVSKLTILRPYGKIAPLPWEDPSGLRLGSTESLFTEGLVDNIHTFGERMDNQSFMDDLSGQLGSARRIVYLGFAYHPINMKLLYSKAAAAQWVLGTVCGMSADNIQIIKSELKAQLGPGAESNLRLNHHECADFMREFRSRLSS